MILVSTVRSTPLALLRLSTRMRLALVISTFVPITLFLWLIFPAPPLDFLLVVPLVLACWLFRWKGGLLCLGAMVLIVGTHYELLLGTAFWRSMWGTFTLTRIAAGLMACTIFAGLRQMTDALLEAQNASQQAQILNQTKDQILYSLSHELRNPLTQVLGYLDLLEDYREQLDEATQSQYLASARGGCEEVLDLISTVLETARTPKQGRVVQLQTIDLHREIQTVLEHLAPPLLAEYPISLELPASLEVQADPRFVRQVVRNLLTNAFKYTPPHTPILVKTVSLDAQIAGQPVQTPAICLQVIDAGAGIPPAQQALLFQPFVRLPNASTSKIPGTGLGLAICKQLVEAMGGHIWVESSGRPGEGCCFSFTMASATQPDNIVAR